jgi:hypothetical protein
MASWSSGIVSAEETGTPGREIETTQGTYRVVALKKYKT